MSETLARLSGVKSTPDGAESQEIFRSEKGLHEDSRLFQYPLTFSLTPTAVEVSLVDRPKSPPSPRVLHNRAWSMRR